MIIDVEGAEKMIDDICNFLNIVPEYLEERIVDIADKAASEDNYSNVLEQKNSNY